MNMSLTSLARRDAKSNFGLGRPYIILEYATKVHSKTNDTSLQIREFSGPVIRLLHRLIIPERCSLDRPRKVEVIQHSFALQIVGAQRLDRCFERGLIYDWNSRVVSPPL